MTGTVAFFYPHLYPTRAFIILHAHSGVQYFKDFTTNEFDKRFEGAKRGANWTRSASGTVSTLLPLRKDFIVHKNSITRPEHGDQGGTRARVASGVFGWTRGISGRSATPNSCSCRRGRPFRNN
ncbi:hypothetical protein J6590_066164 [Homalodisca vitripennis]|nr:hypothetical protein J6590_066164 [Homalodisca vitripennis]